MISSLNGTVLSVTVASVVVDVGGVGFAVQITPGHANNLRVGQKALMSTTLIVRDDSLSLFGFSDEEQLRVFDLLCGVSGVGPKSAIGVLGTLTPDQIAVAVADNDDGAFRKVTGIGPKTAKLIVISLAGKLLAPRVSTSESTVNVASGAAERVLIALIGLGWQEKVAAEAIRTVIGQKPQAGQEDVQALLRMTLSYLGPSPSKEYL